MVLRRNHPFELDLQDYEELSGNLLWIGYENGLPFFLSLENKDAKDNKDIIDVKDVKDNKDIKDWKDVKDNRDIKDAKDVKDFILKLVF